MSAGSDDSAFEAESDASQASSTPAQTRHTAPSAPSATSSRTSQAHAKLPGAPSCSSESDGSQAGLSPGKRPAESEGAADALDSNSSSSTTPTQSSVRRRRNYDPEEALVLPGYTQFRFGNGATGLSRVVDSRIDSGASMTAIPHKLAKELGLRSVSTVKIRTGIDHTERRQVVRVVVTAGRCVHEIEASVRTGKKLGRIPIIGRNWLSLDNILVAVDSDSIIPAMSMAEYRQWRARFYSASRGRPKLERLASSTSSSGQQPVGGGKAHAGAGRASGGLCTRCCAAKPGPLAAKAEARSVRDRAVPPDTPPSTTELPIVEDMVDILFSSPDGAARPVHLPVRVDTGASMTAIPKFLASNLGLQPKGYARIRLGNEHVDMRPVVDVVVQMAGRIVTVEATVRDGDKLGKTAIVGRNLLLATGALVQVVDPKRRSVVKDNKSVRSQSRIVRV